MQSIGPEGWAHSRRHDGPAKPALLRTINDRVALDLFLAHGRLSRSDIARLTGVSKPTASQVLSRLEQLGLLVPAEVTGGHPGRGAQLYELNRNATFAAALEVTPFHIHAQVADITGAVGGEHVLDRAARRAAGRSSASGSADVDEPQDGPDRALAALDAALGQASLTRADLGCIVLGAPGSYDAEADRLKYARHLPGWQQPGLVARLRGALGTPVLVENDVNLAAVAERRMGAAREISDFFLFWVDDGIGGALVIDDRLHRGYSGAAGEIAFLQLPSTGAVRHPVRGNTGAFQRWVGREQVAALARDHGLRGRDPLRLLASAVASTDAASIAFVDELAARFALGLSAVIAVVDPSAILLAGSVPAAGGEVLRARISHHLGKLAIATPPVLASSVPGNPVLTGALCLALDYARERAFELA